MKVGVSSIVSESGSADPLLEDIVLLDLTGDVTGDKVPLLSITARAVVLPTTAELLPNDIGSSATGFVVDALPYWWLLGAWWLLGDTRAGTRARL